MNLVKGITVGGSVVFSFIAGMLVMFKVSEHYQKIIRYWIQARNDPTMGMDPPERRAVKRRPAKTDPLEVKTDEKA